MDLPDVPRGTLITEVDPGHRSSSPGAGGPNQALSLEDTEVVQHTRVPLPRNVHVSVITETILREAPFATGRSKLFWRNYLQHDEFQHLTTDGFWYVLHHVLQRHPENLGESAIFSRLAHSYVSLFQEVPSSSKDTFFAHFYEAFSFSVLLALQSAFPKRRADFDLSLIHISEPTRPY